MCKYRKKDRRKAFCISYLKIAWFYNSYKNTAAAFATAVLILLLFKDDQLTENIIRNNYDYIGYALHQSTV